jgi:hypothetical protein
MQIGGQLGPHCISFNYLSHTYDLEIFSYIFFINYLLIPKQLSIMPKETIDKGSTANAPDVQTSSTAAPSTDPQQSTTAASDTAPDTAPSTQPSTVQVIQELEAKKASLIGFKPQWKANGASFRLNAVGASPSINITQASHQDLVRVSEKLYTLKGASQVMNITSIAYMGHSLQDWEADVRTRVEMLGLQTKISKIETVVEKLRKEVLTRGEQRELVKNQLSDDVAELLNS